MNFAVLEVMAYSPPKKKTVENMWRFGQILRMKFSSFPPFSSIGLGNFFFAKKTLENKTNHFW